MEYVDLEILKGAPYNPRHIEQDKINQLAESIQENGFLLPVIVNKMNNIIIAGHQRSKAAKLAGLSKIPCYFVNNITISDEIMFNQLHNGTDVERQGKAICKNIPKIGFHAVDKSCFKVLECSPEIVKETCKLILKYGNVFQAICDLQGNILKGANYVKSAQLLNQDINLTVADIKRKDLLMDEYGNFSYEHLQKNTWVQGLAQMNRTDNANRSKLYEELVIPFILQNNNVSALDFGCGKGHYIKKIKLNKKIGVEFYPNNRKGIYVDKAMKMIDSLVEHLHRFGRFDIVICDSVLNSVDSMKAETSIMQTLNAMAKINGHLFLSGRSYELEAKKSLGKQHLNSTYRYLLLLDENKFSATFRQGQWYYQKFHTKEEVEELLNKFGFQLEEYICKNSSWRVRAKKIYELPQSQQIDGITFEFNLPLPNGKSYKRDKDVVNAFLQATKNE